MLDVYIEATYESGYVHRETPEDHSPYVLGKNIFNDILEKRPEAIHGPMVRWSLIIPGERFDIKWQDLPEGAKPIRFKHMKREQDLGTGEFKTAGPVIIGIDFGYEYPNPEGGENIKEVMELR